MNMAAEDAYPGMSENVREQVARTLREFRLEPKGRAKTYQKPYPDFFILYLIPRVFGYPNLLGLPGRTLGPPTKTLASFSHSSVITG
jgi:hypothetical protein